VRIRIVGSGQESAKVADLARGLSNIEFVGRVSKEKLALLIAQSHLCLGIFGKTEKAARVIPNKVYECMAMGKAAVTADTPAARELGEAPLRLVPAGDPKALAEAIRELYGDSRERESLGREARAFFTANLSAPIITEPLWRRLA